VPQLPTITEAACWMTGCWSGVDSEAPKPERNIPATPDTTYAGHPSVDFTVLFALAMASPSTPIPAITRNISVSSSSNRTRPTSMW